jgi:hypothetical protein
LVGLRPGSSAKESQAWIVGVERWFLRCVCVVKNTVDIGQFESIQARNEMCEIVYQIENKKQSKEKLTWW